MSQSTNVRNKASATTQGSGEGTLKRELSLLMCTTLCIGAIIGSGIFTMTGTGILYAGKSVPLAFILASLFVAYTNIPSIYQSGALPATGGAYMYVSRFVHPTFGFIHILNSLMGTFNIALMGVSFATYFQSLMPDANSQIVAIIAILLLAVVGTFGVKIAGWLQNLIVVIMGISLLTFIVPGLEAVSDQFITIGEALFMPTVGFSALWSAIAILRYSLQGGGVVFTLGDEVKNPGVTIPSAFFIGTTIVTIFYALIGWISVGTMPLEAVAGQPLSVVADYVLGSTSGAFKFFIVGGALLAILTTLNGSFMIYSRTHFAAARDGIWPKVFTKTNKYGVPWVSLWGCTLIGLAVVAFNLSVSELLNFVAVPGLILGFIYYIPPMRIAKCLPNCARKAWFKVPQPLLVFICCTSAILTFWLGTSLFSRMQPAHYIGMVIFYALGFVYWGLRVKYLKSKGIDLIANMKGMHPYWLKVENEEN